MIDWKTSLLTTTSASVFQPSKLFELLSIVQSTEPIRAYYACAYPGGISRAELLVVARNNVEMPIGRDVRMGLVDVQLVLQLKRFPAANLDTNDVSSRLHYLPLQPGGSTVIRLYNIEQLVSSIIDYTYPAKIYPSWSCIHQQHTSIPNLHWKLIRNIVELTQEEICLLCL